MWRFCKQEVGGSIPPGSMSGTLPAWAIRVDRTVARRGAARLGSRGLRPGTTAVHLNRVSNTPRPRYRRTSREQAPASHRACGQTRPRRSGRLLHPPTDAYCEIREAREVFGDAWTWIADDLNHACILSSPSVEPVPPSLGLHGPAVHLANADRRSGPELAAPPAGGGGFHRASITRLDAERERLASTRSPRFQHFVSRQSWTRTGLHDRILMFREFW